MFSRLAYKDSPRDLDGFLPSDILDHTCTSDNDIDFSFDREIPSRPSSRLGFNRDTIDEFPISEEEDSEDLLSGSDSGERALYIQALESLTQSKSANLDPGVGIFSFGRDYDRDRTLRPSSPLHLHVGGSSLGPKESWDGQDFDTGLYANSFPHEDVDSNIPKFPSLPSPSPIHEFSLPSLESGWKIYPKYSCLPSPLSPRYVNINKFSFHQTPLRHSYQHHGHSRHALHHLKWFWAAREDEWLDHQRQVGESKAYDRLSILNNIPAKLCLRSGCSLDPDATSLPHLVPCGIPHLPPMSIHPRKGDLYTLRDPYCVHIDRYFVGMPVWTMSKTLWMFDVHMGSGAGICEEKEESTASGPNEDPPDEERIGIELLERSSSVGFSDDSDSTLVESDIEEDLLDRIRQVIDDTLEGSMQADDQRNNKDVLSPTLDTGSLAPDNLRKTQFNTGFLEHSATPKSHQHGMDSRSYWPSNWYRRWEVLVQLCFESKLQPDTTSPPIIPKHFSSTVSSIPIKPKSSLVVEGEEHWSENLLGKYRSGVDEEVEDQEYTDTEDVLPLSKVDPQDVAGAQMDVGHQF